MNAEWPELVTIPSRVIDNAIVEWRAQRNSSEKTFRK
jgi:hypothetical protein